MNESLKNNPSLLSARISSVSLCTNIPQLIQACYLYRKHTPFQSQSSDCTVHNKFRFYELHRQGAQSNSNNIAGLMVHGMLSQIL